MARPLRLLSLLSGTGRALSGTPTHGRGFASRGAWTAQSRGPRAPRHHDQEWGDATEEVEDRLQELVNAEMRRRNTIKYSIVRRKMTQPGAPERRLTWEAIEQIRYLKQEQPEEWSVERLAEGFSVSPDAILRVLRSKFTPAAARKAKQDSKVVATLSQQVLPPGAGTGRDQRRLPGNEPVAAITPGSQEGALVPLPDRTLMTRGKNSAALVRHAAPAGLVSTQFNTGVKRDAAVIPNPEEDRLADTDPAENGRDSDESWDGLVFTEEELEEFIEMKKPPPAVQAGNDFFDSEGNFLYRI